MPARYRAAGVTSVRVIRRASADDNGDDANTGQWLDLDEGDLILERRNGEWRVFDVFASPKTGNLCTREVFNGAAAQALALVRERRRQIRGR